MKIAFECCECGHVWSDTFAKITEVEHHCNKGVKIRNPIVDRSEEYPIKCSACDGVRVKFKIK